MLFKEDSFFGGKLFGTIYYTFIGNYLLKNETSFIHLFPCTHLNKQLKTVFIFMEKKFNVNSLSVIGILCTAAVFGTLFVLPQVASLV